MRKKNPNGKVVSYKFKSDELMNLYDQGKISFEEATERIHFLEPVTFMAAKNAAAKYKYYIYPDKFHSGATLFLVLHLTTGECFTKRYMYTAELMSLMNNAQFSVSVTNV